MQSFKLVTEKLFPKSYELIGGTDEIFELNFALWEYENLEKQDLIRRSAYFKLVERIPTIHYQTCNLQNLEEIHQNSSLRTKAFFLNGKYSTGYATHGLFPYRGKFHPQILKPIKGLQNTMKEEYILKSPLELKFKRVIDKNTFYLYDRDFEEKYEGYIASIKETPLVLRNKIVTDGLRRDFLVELIRNKENGLRALLALTGISNEYLKRLITLVRVIDDRELNRLALKDKWLTETEEISQRGVSEWNDSKIAGLIKNNEDFAKGIVNIFFEGSTAPVLTQALPLFELKKLSVEKLEFKIESLVDTLIRYKEKGSYSGKSERNPAELVGKILEGMEVPFVSGDLKRLVGVLDEEKRTMDFIIPDQEDPVIIIESSYVVTTSSGQGDKAKTEINIARLIKKYYPKSSFVGFVDGIGWYVRKNDLKRMVGAYDDVFTFHKEELNRFKELISTVFKK